ncbi:MAG: helix-turn-helix transcriptional regulator [Fidelibacterota bacterium]|nr:MAG: helix-turn-helix transcriptional regulator [Candidatus Neomarinimicrobiota bacterium]
MTRVLESKLPEEPGSNQCCTLEVSGQDLQNLVAMFRGLANPIRFNIMKYLVTHNGCITGNIVDVLPLAQSTVSQHLAVLEETGWIHRSSKGAATCISLNEKRIDWFREWIEKIF